MTELDLQEQTRRDETFDELMEISLHLSQLNVYPSLLWAWTFDIIKDIYQNQYFDLLAVNDYVDEAVPTGITLKQIFNKFWEDVDSLGINMDLDGQIIEEVIRDWMRDNDFLVPLEDEGWLNNV